MKSNKNENPGITYCREAAEGGRYAPKYVVKQCQQVLPIFEGEDEKYTFDEGKLGKIEKILKVLRMPKGLKRGMKIYNCLSGFQWLIILASLCVVYRDNTKKRRFTNVLLEIARKNGKTFLTAIIFILLFFTEPKFSWFYSVAPDGSLSREIQKAIKEIISFNSAVFEMDKKTAFFKIRRDDILFIPKENDYVPLNYSNSRLDGKLPNVFLCDEVGALPNSYAFEAMRSGQLTTLNKLGFLISTKYPESRNPFEDEIELCKKMLDGKFKDEETFALLFEPDETKDWQTNNTSIYQANPLAVDVKEIYDDLLKKRRRAIESEAARENFCCKHLNIVYQGFGTESFVSVESVKRCRADAIDFRGREVYVGVDLAMSNDNCSVSILSVDEAENILCDCYVFIPEGRIREKTAYEKVDYSRFIQKRKCVACGDMTVDYSVIEKFVFDIEERFGCRILAIGYDRYNAMSSAQKWDAKYTTVEVRQHSDTLHMPTKLLYEKIMNKKFKYAESELFEMNFENARCTYDTNMNRYINKKRSNGKVDMVMATIDALYLAQQDIIFGDNFTVQVI